LDRLLRDNSTVEGLTKVVHMYPHRSGPYIRLWQVYKKAGKFTAAVQAFEGFLETYGYQDALLTRLAEAYEAKGEINKAIEML
jgi:tetratricopeptide (TPR) repeat protein